jgi:LuxR family quorum sensing-dependent transcriptional regulator
LAVGTTESYSRRAFDVIAQIEQAKSTSAVMGQLSEALSTFGYTAFLVTGVPEPPVRLQPYILLNGWPRKWAELYETRGYYADDPVAAHCRRSIDPFEWAEAPYDRELAPKAAEVMSIAEDFGMRRGYLVPIVRSTGFHACVTMAGERPDFDPLAKRAIHLISMMAHGRINLLHGESKTISKKLTRREREIMTWVAVGKSSWDIARILGITERTVNFTVGRASQKLDAVNRTQAAVNAVLSGEIEL